MKKIFRALLLVAMMAMMTISVAAARDIDNIDRSFANEIMITRGVITDIRDDRVTIKGADSAYMQEVVLIVNHATHLLNGETGSKLNIKDFSKGMDVTGYFSSEFTYRERVPSGGEANTGTSRNKIPHSSAYALITGSGPQNARYFVVQDAVRSGDSTKVLDFNKIQYINIADRNLMSQGPLKKGQEILAWFKTNTAKLPEQATASKAMILSQPVVDKPMKTSDIMVNMPASTFTVAGKQFPLNTSMARYNNTVYLPIRETGESLGYRVTWNQSTQTAQLQQGNMMATATIGNYNYGKARANIRLDNAPRLINGVTYVPVDFFTRVLDKTVEVKDVR